MLTLPIPVLLIISIAVSVVSSLSRAFYTKKISSSSTDVDIFNFVLNLTCGTVVLLLSGGSIKGSLFSVLFGIAFGSLCFFQLKTNLKALGIGPFAYTTVIVSLSAIIPTLSGLFFGETIDLFQGIGIVLMVICILMSNEKKKGDDRKASTLWLVLCLVSALFNGFIGVFQKIHQSSSHKDEITVFLVSAFAFAALLSLCSLLLERRTSEGRASQKFRLKTWHICVPLIGGIALGTCHVVNLFLSGVVPSATFFPIVNLIPFAISAVAATFLFNERLSRKKLIGIIIGVTATVFVTGVFTDWFEMLKNLI